MTVTGFKKGGADYIDEKIKEAIDDGCRTAIISVFC